MKLKTILVVLASILFSCKNETCEGIFLQNGITYKNNIPYTGTCETFHTNGQLKSLKTYLNGFDHDRWVFYYPNGEMQVTGHFNLGKRDGEWTYFYDNGNVWKKHYYANGNKTGVWKTFDEQENLIEETQIKE